MNTLTDKINNYIVSKFEEHAAKISRGASETAQTQSDVKDTQNELYRTVKNVAQNQTQIAELLKHLGVKFNDLNQLTLEDSYQSSENASPNSLKNQIKAIYMEIKNLANKVPLLSGQVNYTLQHLVLTNLL